MLAPPSTLEPSTKPISRTKLSRTERVEIALLYILLCGGGLWHILGVLQPVMVLLATPMIVLLAAWSFWKTLHAMHTYQSSIAERQQFTVWCAGVFLCGVGVEFVGERTGMIFGNYTYQTAQFPALMPLAIGSAWLGMMLASTATAQRIIVATQAMTNATKHLHNAPNFVAALFVGVLMALFDGLMEPAATALRYWAWQQPYSSLPFLIAPLQNYIAWFCISVVFSFIGLQMGVGSRLFPRFVLHSYIAQALYFVMTNIAH
jgi:putative membrane protein